MKGYTVIDTKFYNLHFSVPGKDGTFSPKGLFYCAYEDDYENRIVHLAIDNSKGSLFVYECIDRKEAESWLEEWMNEE